MRKIFAISLPGPLAWCVGAATGFWGVIPEMIQTWLLLACADWLIGAINAALKGRFCIRESVEGLWRKLVTLVLIGAAHRTVGPLHMPFNVANTIAVAFVLNELISVVLNGADAGVPIPPSWVEFLGRIRKLTGRGVGADEVRAEIEGRAKGQAAG